MLVGGTEAAAGEEWDVEGELLMGMVLEGEGQSVHSFLGSCSVTGHSCQACWAVTAAPSDVP